MQRYTIFVNIYAFLSAFLFSLSIHFSNIHFTIYAIG